MAESGYCVTTPGKQFVAGERQTRAKLNQLGNPSVRVGEGAIGERELDAAAVRALAPATSTNVLINGNFDIWQRGGTAEGAAVGLPANLGETAAFAYGPDRWSLGTPTGAAKRSIFRGPFSLNPEVENARYFLAWNQTAAEAAVLSQPIEDVHTLSGKKACVTVWLWCATTISVTCQLKQSFGGGSPVQVVVSAASGGTMNVVGGASWTKFTAKFEIPSVAGYLDGGDNDALILEFLLPAQAYLLQVAQVQLEEIAEIEDNPTPYNYRTPGQELTACNRYFEFSAGIMVAADVFTLSIPVNLVAITGSIDVVSNIVLGFAFRVLGYQFLVTQAVTTGLKAATLNLEIGTTNITGGSLALTSALCTPLGKFIDASAITHDGTSDGASSSALSVEASGVTAFSEGAGVLLIKIQKTGTSLPCYYFNERKYRTPTLTLTPGWAIAGSGVAFAPLLNVGYYQSAYNTVQAAFYMMADAEIII